jgi:hypothetical protein
LGCLNDAVGRNDQEQVTAHRLRNIVSAIHLQPAAAHVRQGCKRMLTAGDFTDDVVLPERVEIDGNPFAAEFLPPHLVARAAGLSRILTTEQLRGHGHLHQSTEDNQ